MSKKIVSSLIIASCCFNSLPVYGIFDVSTLGAALENTEIGKMYAGPQSVNTNPQSLAQEIEGSVSQAANALEQSMHTARKLGWGKRTVRARRSAKKDCDTKQHSQEELKKYFTSPGATHAYILPVPRISILSSGEIEADYGSMASSLKDFQYQVESQERNFFASAVPSGGSCIIYQTQLGGASLFGLGDRNEAGTLETFAKKTTEKRFFEFFNSRNKQHVVLPEGGIYGFVNLLSNIEGDKNKGIFKASLGHNRLDFHKYNAKISGPHLLAFYNQEKTLFALQDQDDYIELRTESGNQLAQLGNEATHFLKSLFEGSVVKNYFPEELAIAPTTEPFLSALSLNPEPNLSISYSSTGAPMLPPIQRQLPAASSSDYNFKDIGIGAAAVFGGVAVGGMAVVVSIICLLKKFFGNQKHSNRGQRDKKNSPPSVSYASNSLQESRSLVRQGSQDMLREPADGAVIAKAETEYEPPRVFSASTLRLSDEHPRPPTYIEIGESPQDLFSDSYFGSTDSGYSGAASTYLEMHPMPKSISPSDAYANSPQVPPRPTSKENHYDTFFGSKPLNGHQGFQVP
ncbi:MAG: hypothetical protein ACRCYP_07265 [Alphaproteobacteria bacterium]